MTWLYWLIAAFVLLIFEICSGTIAALCCAIGCVPAIFLSLAGASLTWQFIIAAVGAILSLLFLGPILKRVYAKHRHDKKYATGMDALIGRTGIVTHPVTHRHADSGRVQIDGDNWLCYTESPDIPLPKGSLVVVEAYDSIILKVKPKEQ